MGGEGGGFGDEGGGGGGGGRRRDGVVETDGSVGGSGEDVSPWGGRVGYCVDGACVGEGGVVSWGFFSCSLR